MSSILRSGVRGFAKCSYKKRVIKGPSGIYDPSHDGSYKLYRNLSLFLLFPAIGACMANCYIAHQEEYQQPDFIPYTHLRIRNKKYHFGDGVKTFFHNPEKNALPDGYEDDD